MPGAQVYVDFVARGIPDIQKAFKTVADTVVRNERVSTDTAARGSRTRVKIADVEARDKIRAMRLADAEATRAYRAGIRIAEQAAKAEARAAENLARDKVRVMLRADAEIRRAQRAGAREAERLAREEASAFARAEAQKNREAAKWVRQREREQKSQAATQERAISGVLSAAGGGFKAGLGRVAAATQNVASTVLGLGGGFSIADSVQRAGSLSGAAADLANSGYMPNAKPGQPGYGIAKYASRDLVGAVRGTAVKTGLGADDVMGGLQEFVGKSGDLDTGLKVMDKLAILSRATGASFKDVAGAAGELMSQLGDMPNKSEAVMAIMRGIAGQGKLGAVEMKNMASQMAKLAASAGQFGGDAVDNILKMGMLAQESRASGGSSSATMAATSVTGFVNTLKTPARIKQFEAQGIEVFDPKTKMLNDPTKIILQSLQKTGGDPMKMKQLFANVMGERAVGGYANAYRQAEAKEKGSGTAAVQAMFDKHLKGATMSKEEVAKAFSDRMQEADAKMAAIREQFDKAVSERIIPKLLELVPVIEKMIPVFIDLNAQALPVFVDLLKSLAKFVDANKGLISDLAAHPIGTLIAFELTKSIAGAGIGGVVKSLITGLLGGGGGGGGGAGGLAGMGGGAVGAGVLAGTAVAAVVGNAMLKAAPGEERAQDLASKVEAWNRGDHERGVSPEAARKQIDEAKGRLKNTNAFEQAANIITSPFLDVSSKDYGQYKSDKAFTENEQLMKALDQKPLIAALNSAATKIATAAGSTGESGPNFSAPAPNRSVPITSRN